MVKSGNILKMESVLSSPVDYYLPLNEERVHLNPLIGKKIKLKFTGQINCIATGEKIKKSYGQGYSYKAFISLAECDMCIVRPETCHYNKGTCRDSKWGEEHCMQPHIVYLANTGNLKVGITRKKNTPTRWIDQGASEVLPLVEVKDRLTSGLIEKELSQEYEDKTDWRNMLRDQRPEIDLNEIRENIFSAYSDLLDDMGAIDCDSSILKIDYPVHEYPEKVKSLSLDKTPIIESRLNGIKGQYLILDSGVLNLRKYQGYFVEFSHD